MLAQQAEEGVEARIVIAAEADHRDAWGRAQPFDHGETVGDDGERLVGREIGRHRRRRRAVIEDQRLPGFDQGCGGAAEGAFLRLGEAGAEEEIAL
ncbi:MAG: hypothetical protein M0Z85_12340, partial [Gammaproteobacteria bacterium]|nr:hypothetical protein [Gammaproteobacteria bacterium]